MAELAEKIVEATEKKRASCLETTLVNRENYRIVEISVGLVEWAVNEDVTIVRIT